MKLSKRTEYGMRAIVHLARLGPDVYIQAKDLAKQEGLPGKFLESILLILRRGDFLEGKVGSGGGYRLTRSPREIFVGEIVRRLEGRLTQKTGKTPLECSLGESAVHIVNLKLTLATDEILDKLTVEELADLALRGGNLNQSMYYI